VNVAVRVKSLESLKDHESSTSDHILRHWLATEAGDEVVESTFGGKLHVHVTMVEVDTNVKIRVCGLDDAWMVTETKHDPMLFLETLHVSYRR